MPAKSKSQRRLMAIALKIKKGELKRSEASDEAVRLANTMSLKSLEDFASTPEKDLPESVSIDVVPGMGEVKLPESPGNSTDFSKQEPGSGDVPIKNKKFKYFSSYDEYKKSKENDK